jgi:hypothetical protein
LCNVKTQNAESAHILVHFFVCLFHDFRHFICIYCNLMLANRIFSIITTLVYKLQHLFTNYNRKQSYFKDGSKIFAQCSVHLYSASLCPPRTMEATWLLAHCISSTPFLPYTIFRSAPDTTQLSSCLYTGFLLFVTGQSGLSVNLSDYVHLVPGLRLLRT